MVQKTVVLAAIFMALAGSPLCASEQPAPTETARFTLKLENRPLQDVAAEISRQTGYQVVFDEKWNSLQVTGNYADVSLDEFFRRAFRKQNTSLLVNDREKIVALRFFGDKSFADLLAGAATGKGGAVPEDIAELHREQRAELQEYLRDPESVDPLTGMKLTDIRALHEEQQAELAASRQDPETVEPTSGAKQGDLEQLHAAQQAENDQLRNNSGAIEPESGATIGAIAQMHQSQRSEVERMLKDPNTIDPISGMRLGDIWGSSTKPEEGGQ